MPSAARPAGRLSLEPLKHRLPGPVGSLVCPPLERMLCLPPLNRVYDAVADRWDPAAGSAQEFCRGVLEALDLQVAVPPDDLARIPRTGPVIVVANHPFGGIEGLVLASVLSAVRPDVKVLANHLLSHIPELSDLFIFVDPFEGQGARARNAAGLKRALRWLEDGGALGVFPAGTVAHLHVTQRRITDPRWHPHVAALARRTGAQVLPMFFAGANGPLFQVAGLIHPRLRTALLPRELLNKRHGTCAAHIGTPLGADRLAAFDSDARATEYLRLRTEMLATRAAAGQRDRRRRLALAPTPRRHPPTPAAIPSATDPCRLTEDIASLPRDALLATCGDLDVYAAEAHQLPAVLREIGRLREVTFRAVGEGSGQPIDLDRFDRNYLHLVLWHRGEQEIVGAYRLGLIDQLTARRGTDALYLATLFDLSPRLLDRLHPAIELGRSFVRPEYQRSFAPLMLLWKGIGQFIARHPRYRYLIGPASISARYTRASRALIATFLMRRPYRSPLSRRVRPRLPFNPRRGVPPQTLDLAALLADVDELNDVVRDMEPDGKGLPVLLRQYLRLGARALGFNVDPAFGHCVDCLMVFDVPRAEPRTLARYLGREQAQTYLAAHEHRIVPLPSVSRTCPAAPLMDLQLARD